MERGGGYGFFGLAGDGYSNTDQGEVIAAAYPNAFVDLVAHMQRTMPGTAQAEAPIQANTVSRPVILRVLANPTARPVRNFNPGDLVYPTGQKTGIWWEVDDENGNRGWLTSTTITPRG